MIWCYKRLINKKDVPAKVSLLELYITQGIVYTYTMHCHNDWKIISTIFTCILKKKSFLLCNRHLSSIFQKKKIKKKTQNRGKNCVFMYTIYNTYIPLIIEKNSLIWCVVGCWCFLVENKAVAGCYTSAYEMYFWFIWWLFQQGIESAFGVWKITTWVKIIIWNSLGFGL